MNYQLDILLILLSTAVACVLPGCFLVLRAHSMVADAISHSVLLGIVVAFSLTHSFNSPWLLIGAALFAVLMVWLVSLISKAAHTRSDAALGLAYTFFFALAVILISRYFSSYHLDVDQVLLGDVTVAPLRRVSLPPFLGGASYPYSLIQMSVVLLLNVVIILLFYRGLKVTSFDPAFAAVAGFSLAFYEYLLMTVVSLTSVAAFDAVGAILVLALIVTAPATAWLLCKRLRHMIGLSIVFSVLSVVSGYHAALFYNIPYSAGIAASGFILFVLVYLFHQNGSIKSALDHLRLKRRFEQDLLLLHLMNHRREIDANWQKELGLHSILQHLNWKERKLHRHRKALLKKAYARDDADNYVIEITEAGLKEAQALMQRYEIPYIERSLKTD